eukprot:11161819-Lingulodinium_polyedra.AAC.1
MPGCRARSPTAPAACTSGYGPGAPQPRAWSLTPTPWAPATTAGGSRWATASGSWPSGGGRPRRSATWRRTGAPCGSG